MNLSNRNIFVSKTFTKMLLSFLIVVFVTITMVSSVIYYKFSNATIQDIQLNIEEKLKQNMNQLDFMRNEVNALGLQLINDNYIVALIYRKNSSPTINYLAQTKLKQVVDASPMISSIYAYNGTTKKYVSSISESGGDSPLDRAMESEVKKYRDEDRMKFMPLTYIDKDPVGSIDRKRIISIVFNDYPNIKAIKGSGNMDISSSMLIINFKAEYIQQFLTSLYDTKNSDTLIINRAGFVICNSDLRSFGKNLLHNKYVRKIIESKDYEGYLTGRDTEGQFLTTYVASDSSPYLFINNTNYKVLLQRIHALRSTILIVCLLMLLLCIAISVLAAYNVYLPFYKMINSIKGQIKPLGDGKNGKKAYNDIEDLKNIFSNIINRTNELETSIIYNAPFIKKMFLKLLLEGDTSATNHLSKKTGEIKLNISDATSTVILFSIDGYSELEKLKDKLGEGLLVNQIENIIDSIISYNLKVEIVYMERDLIAVIVNVESEVGFENIIKGRMELIQTSVYKEFGITLSAAIGPWVENTDRLHEAYSNCSELLKYRFVYGYKSIIDNVLINSAITTKVMDVDKHRKKIIKCIKDYNSIALELEIDEVFTKITDKKYDYIKLTVNQVTFDVLKEATLLTACENNEEELNALYHLIDNFQTLADLKVWFVENCKKLINRLESKKASKHRDTICVVLSYIEANYFDSEISTESVSEIVKLTPGYLGKLFSENLGKTINEYINELRMKRAREELELSSASVNDIANKVGFSNQSYFTAIFKKHFGITPNQYRLELIKTSNPSNFNKEELF